VRGAVRNDRPYRDDRFGKIGDVAHNFARDIEDSIMTPLIFFGQRRFFILDFVSNAGLVAQTTKTVPDTNGT
jgi:hypothetical protein